MVPDGVRLERLRADHAPALLAFERANRAYFARFVSDRGDAYFLEFATILDERLAEQDAEVCHFHVVVDERGELIGRVNLVDVEEGSADLGYRIGQRSAGRGVATEAVAQVCRLAAGPYGLTELAASTAVGNTGSRTVLERNGFTLVGGQVVAGKPEVRYRRPLERAEAAGPTA
jgi:ribosomal-protein-alanine N-acetyltransferase